MSSNSGPPPQRETTKNLIVHLVSDASGETASQVLRACRQQFQQTHFIERHHTQVSTQSRLMRALEDISAQPGMILYSILDPELTDTLQQYCRKHHLSAVGVLDPVLQALTDALGKPRQLVLAAQHRLNENYFQRIAAVEYALAHDDGQNLSSFDQADIILLGISRCSKSPTCLYLAINKGLRAANYPLTTFEALPPELETIIADGNIPVFGLLHDADMLQQIRETRLRKQRQLGPINYTDPTVIDRELEGAKKLFRRYQLKSVNTSRRSIEETVGQLLEYMEQAQDVAPSPQQAQP